MSDAGWAQAWGQPKADSAEGVRAAPFLSHGLAAGGKEGGAVPGWQYLTVVSLIRWPGKPASRAMNSNQGKVAKSRNEKVMR